VSALAARSDERPAAPDVLEAVDVSKRFGGVDALKGVSLRLPQRAVIGLIGPNGSGKTTLLNCLSGTFAPTSGTIRVGGDAVAGMPANRVARLGIVRTFQNIRLFRNLTARQNVEISALAAGRVPRRRLGLRLDVGREGGRDAGLAADRLEALAHRRGRDDADPAGRHQASEVTKASRRTPGEGDQSRSGARRNPARS
jgi:ABC-type branched-subunit amino acid transport system ATPase component